MKRIYIIITTIIVFTSIIKAENIEWNPTGDQIIYRNRTNLMIDWKSKHDADLIIRYEQSDYNGYSNNKIIPYKTEITKDDINFGGDFIFTDWSFKSNITTKYDASIKIQEDDSKLWITTAFPYLYKNEPINMFYFFNWYISHEYFYIFSDSKAPTIFQIGNYEFFNSSKNSAYKMYSKKGITQYIEKCDITTNSYYNAIKSSNTADIIFKGMIEKQRSSNSTWINFTIRLANYEFHDLKLNDFSSGGINYVFENKVIKQAFYPSDGIIDITDMLKDDNINKRYNEIYPLIQIEGASNLCYKNGDRIMLNLGNATHSKSGYKNTVTFKLFDIDYKFHFYCYSEPEQIDINNKTFEKNLSEIAGGKISIIGLSSIIENYYENSDDNLYMEIGQLNSSNAEVKIDEVDLISYTITSDIAKNYKDYDFYYKISYDKDSNKFVKGNFTLRIHDDRFDISLNNTTFCADKTVLDLKNILEITPKKATVPPTLNNLQNVKYLVGTSVINNGMYYLKDAGNITLKFKYSYKQFGEKEVNLDFTVNALPQIPTEVMPELINDDEINIDDVLPLSPNTTKTVKEQSTSYIKNSNYISASPIPSSTTINFEYILTDNTNFCTDSKFFSIPVKKLNYKTVHSNIYLSTQYIDLKELDDDDLQEDIQNNKLQFYVGKYTSISDLVEENKISDFDYKIATKELYEKSGGNLYSNKVIDCYITAVYENPNNYGNPTKHLFPIALKIKDNSFKIKFNESKTYEFNETADGESNSIVNLTEYLIKEFNADDLDLTNGIWKETKRIGAEKSINIQSGQLELKSYIDSLVVEYSITNATGWKETIEASFKIHQLPRFEFKNIAALCYDLKLELGDKIKLGNGCVEGDGNWDGEGVSNGIFNPHFLTVGNHTINYTYINKYGGATSKDIDIQIDSKLPATAKFYDLPETCAKAGKINLRDYVNTNEGTGSFQGTGVVGESFDPKIAGPGLHYLKYIIEDEDNPQCNYEIVKSIYVNESPSFSVVNLPPMYIDTQKIDLINYINTNGTIQSITGNGIINNVFHNLFVAEGSVNKITVTLLSSNGCATVEEFNITSQAKLPSGFVMNQIHDACQNDPKLDLTKIINFNDGNVSFSSEYGTFISEDNFLEFDKSNIDGKNKVIATYKKNGFSIKKEVEFYIHPTSKLEIYSLPPIQYKGQKIYLQDYVNYKGGSFDGRGIYQDTMYADKLDKVNSNNNEFTYIYTNTEGCISQASETAEVEAQIPIELMGFSEFPSLCNTSEKVDLFNYINPLLKTENVEFKGIGVKDEHYLDPRIMRTDIKNYISAKYSEENFSESFYTYITITKSLEVTIDTYNMPTLCKDTQTIDLMNYVNLKGGTFTGKGVINNKFYNKLVKDLENVEIKYTLPEGEDYLCSSETKFSLNSSAHLTGIDFNSKLILDEYDNNSNLGEYIYFTPSSDKMDSYNWNFGDGFESNYTNPKFAYYMPGTYTVSLEIDKNGCSDKIEKKDYIDIKEMEVGGVKKKLYYIDGKPIESSNDKEIKIYYTYNKIHINSNDVISNVEIYSLSGNKIFNSNYSGTSVEITFNEKGIYFVKTKDKITKIIAY